MGKKIAVVGTGGTGSTISGLLTKAGHDVTMIDKWPDHVTSMVASGLHIATQEEDFRVPVHAIHLHEVSDLRESFDIVFFPSDHFDTTPDHIALGLGSSEILSSAVRLFAGPDRPVITSGLSFAAPITAAKQYGYPWTGVPLDADLKLDLEAMAEAARPAYK